MSAIGATRMPMSHSGGKHLTIDVAANSDDGGAAVFRRVVQLPRNRPPEEVRMRAAAAFA